MADRDLGFNIVANAARALEALGRMSEGLDRVADRIIRLGATRANPRVTVDTSEIERKIDQVKAKLEELKAKKNDPTIDANITLAETKLTRLEAKLDELKAKRVDPVVDLEIASAEAKLAEIEAKLEELSKKAPSPVVNMQTALFNNQAALVRAKLDELNAKRVDPVVDLEIAEMEAKIILVTAKIDELKAKKADVKIDADIAEFEAKLVLLEAQLALVRTQGAGVRVGGSSASQDVTTLIGKLEILGGSILGAVKSSAQLAQNFRGLAIVSSISAGLPTLVSLTDTLVTASQAALLLPAGIAAAGAAFLTLGIGLSGIAKALGPENTAAQIKQVDIAMSHLSPTARDVVTQLREMLPMWHSIKVEVQDKMFSGVATEIKDLGTTYLPVFKNGLGGIASSFNTVIQEFSKFLLQSDTVKDTVLIFSQVKRSINDATPGMISLSSAFKDFAVVGSDYLPVLATAFSKVSAEFADFTAKARADGSMRLWIAQGIGALEELGNLVKNVAHVFGDLFEASEKAGASTVSILNQAISTLHEFLSSGQGQNGLINLFQGIRDTINAIKPGVVAVLDAIAEAVGYLRPTVVSLGEAFSSIAKAVAPTIPMIAQLGGQLLAPLITAVKWLADTFGGLIPIILTAAVAIKAFGAAGALVATVAAGITRVGAAVGTASTGIALFGTRMGASNAAMGNLATAGTKVEGAMTKVGSALSKAGAALPVIGVAIVALVALWDYLGSHAEENADKVVKGSMTMNQAVSDQLAQMNKNYLDVFGDRASKQAQWYAQALNDVNQALQNQLNSMSPLQRAQAEVTIAQNAYQEALSQGASGSQALTTASAALAAAKSNLTNLTEAQTRAEKDSVQAMIDASNAAAGAANADLGYEQALLRIESATKAASDAVKEHGKSSIEARQAQADLTAAYLAAADGARKKTEADATARGESDAAAQGATAYRAELLRLADQASGPTRDALLKAAAAAGDMGAQSKIATDLAAKQRDQLAQLASTASGPLKDAILGAKANFDTLGGAHASAQERAQAQKDELNRLADMASGPLKTALQGMANQITSIPNGSFTITANGTMGQISGFDTPELLRMAHGGFTGGVIETDDNGVSGIQRQAYASGGVTPGYTPGRDVHHYYSSTGGKLSLSGGEAIMRPEWTAAVGTNYVHAANAAARSGGSSGVRRFMNGGTFADGGILDDIPHQKFAFGGLVMGGVQPFQEESRQDYIKTAQAAIAALTPIVDNLAKGATNAINAMLAAKAAAAAAAAGAAAGAAPAAAGGNVGLVQSMAASRGWTGAQWDALYAVVMRESGFNNNAQNPTSTAYGMFQFLDTTWGAYGASKTSDPTAQTVAGLNYIASRYGTPSAALAHENAYGWYDKGGIAADSGFMAKLTNLPERVLSPDQTKSFERLVGWLTNAPRQGTHGGSTSSSSGDATTAEVGQLRADIRALGDTIQRSVAEARPITVEDRSGNPVETGRAVSLALRH